MAEWRIGRGWSEKELEERLDRLQGAGRNFPGAIDQMTLEKGWHQYYSEAVIASENPGPPENNGPFQRGKVAVANYTFSDPRIVIGHFKPEVPLLGRIMLLEMRAMRFLHYLGGVIVGAAESKTEDHRTVFGYRYETLEGHIEEGYEWFLMTKDHQSGKIHFRIEAFWRPGQFPNWWSRLGFSLVGPHYQRKWHHQAHNLLSMQVQDSSAGTPPKQGRLLHTTPEVVFKRFRAIRREGVESNRAWK